ncbi:hypothetical protein [Streptomyces sp. NPDC002265]|uniref:hypothetical protein n=1 Tax=Streptomyces sp. NPDC002265 TaxID=3154415 RepID=UPI00333030BB
MSGLREMGAPFVVPGPSGVAVRDRLKNLTAQDEAVLRLVGGHLGTLAARDLQVRCAAGLEHDNEQWAHRKRELTGRSSSRWAGSLTKATHDQWALARRAQQAHIRKHEAGVNAIRHRLSLPLRERGGKRAAGGYRSRREWHAKTRRLRVLEDRLERARTDWAAGRVRVVRGGKRLLNARHHLEQARLTESRWRARWEAARHFLQADGETGKRYGNETIRVGPDGEVSIKLPAPLAHLANAPHDRYVLGARVSFALEHPIRRRTAPPRTHQSDGYGHRTVQAGPATPGREGPRPRIPGPRTRSVPPGFGVNAGDQNALHRSGRSAEHEPWQQDSLPLSL